MSLQRIKTNFMRLEGGKKFILLGSLILALSTFLPWYAERDSFSGFTVGDRFLGVTGPASLVGFFILVIAAFSFYLSLQHLLQNKVPKLPVSEQSYHLFTGLQSFFLLVIVNSIYFHPKFGVNITLKESEFGTIFAFAGAILLGWGAWNELRNASKEHLEIGKLEPLVPAETVSVRERQHEAPMKQPVAAEEERPKPRIIIKRDPVTGEAVLPKNYPILGESGGLRDRMQGSVRPLRQEQSRHEQTLQTPKPHELEPTPTSLAHEDDEGRLRMDI